MVRLAGLAMLLFLLPGGPELHAQVAAPGEPAGRVLFQLDPAPPWAETFACRRRLTYLRTAIPPWQEARPWFLTLFTGPPEPDPERLAVRRRCLALLDQPLVDFDPGEAAIEIPEVDVERPLLPPPAE